MRKLLVATAAAATLAAFATSAFAADLARPVYKAPPPPPPPVATWTGCYLGVNGGGGWKRTDYDITNNSAGFFGPAFAAGSTPSLYRLHDMSGGIVGGTIGCNYQAGQFVAGLEADYDWANISGSQSISTAVPGFVPGFGSATEKLTSLGTFRGRVGPTFGNLFLYATGGLAWGTANYNYSWAYPGTGELYLGSASATKAGWTAGVGGEYAFTANWSAKVEALAFELGGTNFFAPGTTASTPAGLGHIVSTTRDDGWIVRAGLNYRFNLGGPIAARY